MPFAFRIQNYSTPFASSMALVFLCCVTVKLARVLIISRARRGQLDDTWSMDEMFITIGGRLQYLWHSAGACFNISAPKMCDAIGRSARGSGDGRCRRAARTPRVGEFGAGTSEVQRKIIGRLRARPLT
jgi:hypothetical protein